MKFLSLTLYQVDVAPPELHRVQPLLSVFLEPPQKPAGALPELAPTAELLSFSQTLRTAKNKES